MDRLNLNAKNTVKMHRTIPIDLEDWLHGFRSSLEAHPFPKETMGCCKQGGEQPLGVDAVSNHPMPLLPAVASDNIVLSFAV